MGVLLMDKRLLTALLRKKEVTIEEIKEFYGLNIEQTIELLLQYLNETLDEIEQNDKVEFPKYLFRVLQKIDHLYGVYVDDGNHHLPNYRLYQEIQERVFSLAKTRKIISNDDSGLKDDWYLNVYYYHQECYAKYLMNSPEFLELLIRDKTILDDFFQNYLNQLFTDDYIEYRYWKSILRYLLLETEHIEPWMNEFAQKIDHYIKNELTDFPSKYRYRLNELMHLCIQMKYRELPHSNHYHVEFLPSKKQSSSLEIFTIDEENTGLREDALSIFEENGFVHVTMYITDPTEQFMAEEALIEEAFMNWFVYRRDYVFDYEYAKENFSLDCRKERPVIAYEMIFNQENELIEILVYPTNISVSKNYSYDRMKDKIGRMKPEEVDEKARLYEIAKALHEANYSKKRYHKIKELQYYLEYNKKYQPESKYMVISEFKVLLGTILAKVFLERELPLIYRNNESEVTKQAVEQIEEKCNQENEESSIRRKIEDLNLHSYYSYENVGHRGLGVNQYTHITTPLRNYFALINMMILKELLIYNKKDEIPTYQELVEKLIELQYGKQQDKQKVLELHSIKQSCQGE